MRPDDVVALAYRDHKDQEEFGSPFLISPDKAGRVNTRQVDGTPAGPWQRHSAFFEIYRARGLLSEPDLHHERIACASAMLSRTILLPFDEYQRADLRGTTMGISWRRENLPYAARMIWRHVGAEPDLCELLACCGSLPL